MNTELKPFFTPFSPSITTISEEYDKGASSSIPFPAESLETAIQETALPMIGEKVGQLQPPTKKRKKRKKRSLAERQNIEHAVQKVVRLPIPRKMTLKQRSDFEIELKSELQSQHVRLFDFVSFRLLRYEAKILARIQFKQKHSKKPLAGKTLEKVREISAFIHLLMFSLDKYTSDQQKDSILNILKRLQELSEDVFKDIQETKDFLRLLNYLHDTVLDPSFNSNLQSCGQAGDEVIYGKLRAVKKFNVSRDALELLKNIFYQQVVVFDSECSLETCGGKQLEPLDEITLLLRKTSNCSAKLDLKIALDYLIYLVQFNNVLNSTVVRKAINSDESLPLNKIIDLHLRLGKEHLSDELKSNAENLEYDLLSEILDMPVKYVL